VAEAAGSAGTARSLSLSHRSTLLEETAMGKYFIGWLLGVPAILLVILYFFFH
jgi:hypothetical protein